MTGVVAGSFLIIGVFGELVFDGVKSSLTGVDSFLAGVDTVLAGAGVDVVLAETGVEPLTAATFLAYKKQEYM